MKNDSADLNGTVAKEQDKLSAHIGSIFIGLNTYEANTVLKDWSNSTGHTARKMTV